MEKFKRALEILWELSAIAVPLAIIVLLLAMTIFGGKIHIECAGIWR